ncbi:MAG: AAA family ATPase [Paraprevotella sp.]|nr:AAA family ATPase [Paraprevotella sp.]
MKENILPFSLARILFNVLDPDFRPTRSALSEMVFDQRHDFVLDLPSPRLAVRMTFTNERCMNGVSGKGVRRPVDVTLFDSVNKKIHAVTTVSVNLKNGEAYGDFHACLPIDFYKVDFDHAYLVTVRDKKSGHLLGEQELRFFRRLYCGCNVEEILNPVCAGIEPNGEDALYRSFDADLMVCHNVRFHLVPEDTVALPAFLPEMEVRIYLPDGTMESKFVTPVMDEDDAKCETYRVSASFYMTQSKKGAGYAELICFGSQVAGIVFDTDGDTVCGSWHAPYLEPFDEYSLCDTVERLKSTIDRCLEETSNSDTDDIFEKALEEFIASQQVSEDADTDAVEESVSSMDALDNLTGLRSVKEKLLAYENLVLFNKRRQECDLPVLSLPLHAMFLGSPGTGKTTVANRMGLMLQRAGVLSKGHVVIRERATLLGPYYSNEETNTLAAIEEAQGGILFIDEAYQLYQPDDPRDPGKFVIEALITALADESKRDWMLILAGYTDEMRQMFEMNSGLKSRIPESNIYIFDDFSEEELMEIAERYLARNSYSLTPDAKLSLSSRLEDDYRNRDKTFGNARHVINLIQTEILPSMASRVVSTGNVDTESLSLIRSCDIPKSKAPVLCSRPKIGYCA